ncbi:hypothetical protein SAMN03080617_01176 [Algoriphagus alkaliphilus]|uniref:Uncharacterized protein n=1 Tax=Algoriphagus alkaliphilus TaxID=279824 RepID=A0A1G5WMW3_9BACT|nr:hypothetical protein [Cyclobacterium sp.]SDA59352.1 hypothetical protein SAMN03080617_01176 [Algoriphagus alkaliphilus]
MVEPFLKFNFGISFISEVELLGFKGISKSDEMPMRKTLTQGDAPSYRGRAFHVTNEKQIINT